MGVLTNKWLAGGLLLTCLFVEKALASCPDKVLIAGLDMYSGGKTLSLEASAQEGIRCIHINSRRKESFSSSQWAQIDSPPYQLRLDGSKDFELLASEIELLPTIPDIFLAGTDGAVPLADRLNRRFKKPGNNPDTSHFRTDKFFMNDVLDRVEIPERIKVAQRIVRSSGELARFAVELERNDRLGIAKPLSSSGTDKVIEWRSPSEAREIGDSIFGKGVTTKRGEVISALLGMEFVPGTEIALDTLSWNAAHYLIATFVYQKLPVTTDSGGQALVYRTADLLDPFAKETRRYFNFVTSVYEATELETGFGHTEVMVNEKGIALVEINQRPAGWPFAEAENAGTGTNQMRSMLQLVKSKGRLNPTPQKFQPTRIVFLIAKQGGHLASLPQINDFKHLPSYHYYEPWAKAGTQIRKTQDTASIPGILILSHPDANQLETDYQKALKIEEAKLVVQ